MRVGPAREDHHDGVLDLKWVPLIVAWRSTRCALSSPPGGADASSASDCVGIHLAVIMQM
jgi:hypothetical protein